MKRRARPNSLNVARHFVNLVQEFKQRIYEKLQLLEFTYYYRIKGKTNLAKIDEKVIDEAKRKCLAKPYKKCPGANFLTNN